ncbi:hypothetical protein B7P43_G01631 [Cryptotermes secundus]|uniref:MD-2-related lipid-recognition domain-containing protein n=2 Tax=Cryptotermes secundus TaxID=105785 RepID=A0A2J7QLY0_9NEOP|nr:hypothetical protein B7P43_G01631 [Cryptotermes secundus]
MALYSLCLLLLCVVIASRATRNYHVRIKGAELKQAHGGYYGEDTDFEINKYNETTDSINAVVRMLKDLPQGTTVDIQSYELQSNQWQKSTVHINKTWCEFITSDPYFMEGIIRQSNYPKTCPIKANTFKIENFVIDEEKFPEQIPGEHWRYIFKQFVNNECILEFLFDIQIQRTNQLI